MGHGLVSVALCWGLAGRRSLPWRRLMSSRWWRLLRVFRAQCFCRRFRPGCWGRRAWPSRRRTCCITWSRLRVRCTVTGGRGRPGGRLALVLIAGTLPGVIAGSVIRVELLPGEDVFNVVVAVVLIPLGFWLALTWPPAADVPARPARVIPVPALVALAAVVGCVGGIYGIGGGAILAPVLDRVGPAGIGGCSCRAGLHVRDLGCGRDHVHALVPSPPGRVGSGLAHWPRAGCRGPGRRLYRCAYPVPDA